MDDLTRRRFLQVSGIAGMIGFTGCSSPINSNTPTPANKDTDGDGVINSEDYAPRDSSVQRAEQVKESSGSTPTQGTSESGSTSTERPAPTESPTPPQNPQWMFDFTQSKRQLSNNNWVFGSEVKVQNSDLIGNGAKKDFTYSVHPISSSGVLNIEGAINPERLLGFHFALTEQNVDPNSPEPVLGYWFNIRQTRRNTILFTRRDSKSDSETLFESNFNHNGERHNYRIRLSDNNVFKIFINGREAASITDDAYNPTNLVIRSDGPDQRVDKVSFENL